MCSYNKKANEVRRIELPVGVFYHVSYQAWIKHGQEQEFASDAIKDEIADAVAEQFDSLCESSKHQAGKVLVQLSKTGRIKIGTKRYDVKKDGVVFWILP